MANQVLPPLPPSDPASLAQNRWDQNYETRSGNFWDGAVTHIEDGPMTNCNHYFIKTETGVRCNKCHFGLSGNFVIQDGKLFINGRSLGL